MNRDWARLGRELADAREARALKQEEVAVTLGVSRSTVQSIEHGKPRKKVTPTIRGYAQLVGWTDDSPELVLAGGTPRRRNAGPTPQAAPSGNEPEPVAAPDLSLRVRQALEEGPLLDSQVLTVSTPGGDVRATIVVRGEPGATPEALHQALLAWRDRDAALGLLREGSGDVPDSST